MPPLLKVSDVAELLQVTPAFVYGHARELGAFKVGRHLRFARSDVEAWLEPRRLGEPSWEQALRGVDRSDAGQGALRRRRRTCLTGGC